MEQISRAEQLEKKRAYWKQHIDGWQQTGLTPMEYCLRHNLKHHQLVYWSNRFLKTERDVTLVPLKLEESLDIPSGLEHASLTLVIDNQFKNEIKSGFDPQLLRQVKFFVASPSMILPISPQVYLALGSTDLRKAINGLSILVEQAMGLNPSLGDRFEFIYMPKHRSWMNMAEIELNVLIGQCLDRPVIGPKIPD